MKHLNRISLLVAVISFFLFLFAGSAAGNLESSRSGTLALYPPLTDEPDTTDLELPYPFDDESEYPIENQSNLSGGVQLGLPSNITNEVEYDPLTQQYIFSQQVGDLNFRYPASMSIEEYQDYEFNESIRKYWKQRYQSESFANQSSLIPKLQVGGEVFDKIFGSSTINIQPQGAAELIFGINVSNNGNPQLPERMRRITTFDFQEKIQMNVTGQIGDKMRIQTNYNTESTFDFENRMNLRYDGHEDEIIQVVEAGDVTLPLSGTLITGSQSLFGIKTEMKFGKLRMTTVFSQQRGESSSIQIEGGAQVSEFEVWADDYETNRHFFLSQYFKDRYDASLSTLPVISSGMTINRVEIWVTNKTGNFNDARNIVAFVDLAEGAYNPAGPNGNYGMYNRETPDFNSNILNPIVAVHNLQAPEVPHNGWNDLYAKMTTDYADIRDIALVSTTLGPLSTENFISGQDYEKIEKARKLMPSEYTLNDKLGFISVNAALNADDVLAVAYEYTLNGQIYRVGEFSNDGPADPNTLICKLIKGTYLSPNLRINNERVLSPTWELMMKNIYALGAYQINPQDFILNVMYQNDLTGTAINYIPEGPKKEDGGINGEPLLRVMNLDNLNANQDPYPDGIFDFVNGVTINPSNGRVIFPVREPFGSYLREKIEAGNPDNASIADKYVYDMLYDSTQTVAQQQADKNKFFMKGTYTSASGSEISLNALNIPQGSVIVTAGGQPLTEGQDYTVDYNMGRVTIINQGLLESGTPINISLESNSMFNIQTKTLIGTNFNYRFNNDFALGATILNLTERPLTTKVNFGNEPISNTIWGVDGNYRSEVPFITKLVDKLPFIETKEKSTVQLFAEFAQLIPGHSRIIDNSGTVYIDDFEGSKTLIDLRNWGAWVLASTPQHQPNLFPEAASSNTGLDYGKNRALLAWYSIDPLYLRNNAATPAHIRNNPDLQSSHFVREVYEREIFPNRETPNGVPTNMQVLNLAYYPSERGPYNFDLNPGTYSAGIRTDGSGLLANPESRWAGVMRSVNTNDFEEANIEFVEFWLMDPFAEDEDSTHTGGKLYFNIGNVSEDILRDGRKAFEHGLPGPNDPIYLDTTIWGVIPVVQSLVPAFDANNNNEKRPYQDVGFDGLSSAMGNEQEFHSDYVSQAEQLFLAGLLSEESYQSILNDPSNDDFHYHRGGDYDALELGILDRYKRFNGTENNAPASEQFTEEYPTSSTTIPDVEDINNDNTLSEIESYYQYEIPITYQNLRIDKKYISDEIVTFETFKNGETSPVTWYQFKVPIYEPDQVIGSISDFKSIRFMRMFLKDFEEEVILRFARLDLVRGEWRKYNASMREAGEYEPIPQPVNSYFDVSAVNIEENGNRSPINYILPPGIDRVIDPTNPQLRQLNEQAMTLRVIELEDGDSRAAFKNVNVDLRQYKRVIMDVHAESLDPYILEDEELRVFIRIGSDYRQNYYEYEVPLKVTPPGRYDNNNESDRELVWPDLNRLNIELEVFQEIKQLRNNANRENPINVSINSPFSKLDERRLDENGNPRNKITIVGNPNLSNVRTVMVGVRNPKARSEFSNVNDDGNPKSGEIWVNELRLTDFDDQGGWAANARAMTQLADLGTLSMAGNIKKAGFGGIESKVNTRSREETMAYDISSNLELGRFFGAESGVRLPMFVGYSENISNPEYNPVDPDIPLKVALDQAPDKATRDSIKHISQTYTRRKSINFTNISVQSKNMAEPKLWDIGNWSASYAFSEIFSRSINTEYNVVRDYRGALNYNFSARPKNITPFRQSKSKLLNMKFMRLIKDFNFFYLPQQIAFRTEINRNYLESKMRNLNTSYIDNAEVEIPVTFQKNFVWNRNYDVKYDLSRALKVDFSATNMARIDEPDGRINRDEDPLGYQQWRDEVWRNFSNFGRTTQYNHILNVNWNVPINRLPLLDFTSLSLRYTGSYDWITSPILTDSIVIGNTIKNANSMQANSQINMLTLYNKVPYLKTLNQKYSGRGRQRGGMRPPPQRGGGKDGDNEKDKEDGTEIVTYERTGVNFTAGTPRGFNHQLGTEDVEVTCFDERGNRVFGQQKVISEDRVTYLIEEDKQNVKVVIKGRKKESVNYLKIILERSLVTLMGIKNFSVSYTLGAGTVLPGYLPESRLFGSTMLGGAIVPGIPFILGWQDPNLARNAAENGWLTGDPILNTPFAMNENQNINIRSSIEPIPGMRVDVTANRTANRNSSEFYLQDSTGTFTSNSLSISGNFSMTIMTIGTSFEPVGEDDYSQTFENFKNYRITIAQRFRDERAALDPNYGGAASPETGFPEGYGPSSQNVMIPAFLAAYTNTSPDNISLSAFPNLLNLRPNWRLTWDGLSDIEWVKKYIKTVAVNHTYRSTYNVGSYTTNLFYRENEDGLSQTRDLLDNFLPQNEIAAVSINEQFSPLLNFDMTWNNSMTTRVEMKSTRNMTLSFANQQISEMRNQEYIVGAGYRFSQVAIFISGREFKSDLTVRFDFSYRENRSIIRQIDGIGATQPTSGQRVIGIKTNADYVLSDRFNVRAFIDYTNNKPFISNSYPTSNWNFGFSVRFQLAG